MSNEQTPVEQEDDLDAFSAEFFGQNKAPKEQASSEEKDEKDELDPDATEEKDTHLGEDDTPATDEDEPEEDEEEVEEPAPKPKKSRAQERIEELNAKYRETERKLAEVMAKLEQNEKPTPEPVKAKADSGPTPDDKNEDGTDKYELGEFDPQYIRDLTKHTFQEMAREAEKEQAQKAEQTEMEKQRIALQSDWEQKLGPAQERYPDFVEKGQELLSQFDDLDQGYAEYLTTTLMSLENGHDVLYYLASNPDEAVKIVNSGAAKATIAFGRLDAKFVTDEEETKVRPTKVSKAPTPPIHMNKGSSVAKASVAPDTDDLDAFASEFFATKKRRG